MTLPLSFRGAGLRTCKGGAVSAEGLNAKEYQRSSASLTMFEVVTVSFPMLTQNTKRENTAAMKTKKMERWNVHLGSDIRPEAGLDLRR